MKRYFIFKHNHEPHGNILVNDGLHLGVPHDIRAITVVKSGATHYSRVGGDAGVRNPPALPVL